MLCHLYFADEKHYTVRLNNLLPASWWVVQPELEPGLTPKPTSYPQTTFIVAAFRGPGPKVCLYEQGKNRQVATSLHNLYMMGLKGEVEGMCRALNKSSFQNPAP